MGRFVIAAFVLMAPVVVGAQPAKEPYAPGLGEFMAATQLRHAKLWFAGQAKNWDLAGYEVDEIKEGLEDAAKQFPTPGQRVEVNMTAAPIYPAGIWDPKRRTCGVA